MDSTSWYLCGDSQIVTHFWRHKSNRRVLFGSIQKYTISRPLCILKLCMSQDREFFAVKENPNLNCLDDWRLDFGLLIRENARLVAIFLDAVFCIPPEANSSNHLWARALCMQLAMPLLSRLDVLFGAHRTPLSALFRDLCCQCCYSNVTN